MNAMIQKQINATAVRLRERIACFASMKDFQLRPAINVVQHVSNFVDEPGLFSKVGLWSH